MPTLPRFGAKLKESWGSVHARLLSGHSDSVRTLGSLRHGESGNKGSYGQSSRRNGAIQLGDELDEVHLTRP